MRKERYVTKPIVDKGPKNTYWRIKLIKTYPFLDNFKSHGTVGTTSEYVITAYLKFDEPKSEWFITKLLRPDRYEIHYSKGIGYVVPIGYNVLNIRMIDKEEYIDGTYFKSSDWTENLMEPVKSLEEWSKLADMSVINHINSYSPLKCV
jgi:hypothetical protein